VCRRSLKDPPVSKSARVEISECRARKEGLVNFPRQSEDNFGVLQGVKIINAKALVAELVGEGFQETVFQSWLGEMKNRLGSSADSGKASLMGCLMSSVRSVSREPRWILRSRNCSAKSRPVIEWSKLSSWPRNTVWVSRRVGLVRLTEG